MKTVTLFPKSNKGKNLIKRFGDAWSILRHEANVPCCDNGEGFLIIPINPAEILPMSKGDASRWVACCNDSDFNVKVN